MGKFIKKFENHSNYSTFIATTEFIKPNVSYCVTENEVHYNPWTYADAYLTFKALEDGTFQLSTNAVSYSLDNGETWTSLAAATSTPTVTAGSKIMWKASGLQPTSSNGIGTFSSTAKFDVEGNPMSLLYGDDFAGQNDLTGKNYAFYRLFYNCSELINVEKMSLPATTLASNCYNSMFYGCTSLATAPQLPATTLATSCYNSMFYGCTKLNYIKAMFTTEPSTTYTTNWVSGVAASGTFVKNSAAQWDVSGVNGIPSGWTVVTE